MKREFQINFLKDAGLLSSDKFLDLGCGTLRGGIPIIKYLDIGNYFGIDIREKAINEGLKEIVEEKLEFKEPNVMSFERFEELKFNIQFDKILAFSVLIHMTDSITNSCLNFVSRVLVTNGSFYANVNIGESTLGEWQAFPVIARKLKFYQKLAHANGMKVRDLGELSFLNHKSGVVQQDNQHMLEFSKV